MLCNVLNLDVERHIHAKRIRSLKWEHGECRKHDLDLPDKDHKQEVPQFTDENTCYDDQCLATPSNAIHLVKEQILLGKDQTLKQ